MDLRTVLKYTALAIGVLVLVSALVTAVSMILSIVWAVVTTVATLLVLGGLLYGAVKLFSWFASDGSTDRDSVGTGSGLSTGPSVDESSVPGLSSDSDGTNTTTDGQVARLQEKYANGEISEATLERRLELALDGPDDDEELDLDRV